MAEPQNDRHMPERYEETTDPKNPPNSVLNEHVRSTALRSYLGPLVVFFIVVGVALVYWANRGPVVPDAEDRDQQQVGTTGVPDEDPRDTWGERLNRDDTPGGTNPDPRPDSTADELRYRGTDSTANALPGLQRDATLTGLDMLEGEPKNLVGRRVEFRNVNVVDAQDATHFWIQERNVKAEVAAPRGSPAVKAGSRVNVSGVLESDGRDGVRIRADRIDPQ